MMLINWIGEKEIKGYTKDYSVVVDGVFYLVNLRWDDFDGYDTRWSIKGETVAIPESVEKTADKEGVPVGYLIEMLEQGETINV